MLKAVRGGRAPAQLRGRRQGFWGRAGLTQKRNGVGRLSAPAQAACPACLPVRLGRGGSATPPASSPSRSQGEAGGQAVGCLPHHQQAGGQGQAVGGGADGERRARKLGGGRGGSNGLGALVAGGAQHGAGGG